MNTDFSLRAFVIFWFLGSSCRGIMRPAFCCTRRQAGMARGWTAPLTAHGVAKEPFCAPQIRKHGAPCIQLCSPRRAIAPVSRQGKRELFRGGSIDVSREDSQKAGNDALNARIRLRQ